MDSHPGMSAANLLGQSLGAYQVIEEIGRGGMGRVYKGLHVPSKRYVALKVLSPHLAEDPALVTRFRREAKAVALLDHPNIVGIHEVGAERGIHFLAMELIDGETLGERLRREGMLPLREVESIISQLADALTYAHGRGVIHRDVKPGNVLLERAGRVVLTDFGIALVRQVTRLTQDGQSVGTVEYMSPEQSIGKKVDARTDVYSLGIVAYEMLTGRVPFTADSPIAVLHKQTYEPPPPLREFNPRIPVLVESVVLKTIAKDPGKRYASAREVAAELGRARAGKTVVAHGDVVTRERRTPVASEQVRAREVQAGPRSRGRARWVVLLILLIAVVGVAYYWEAVEPGLLWAREVALGLLRGSPGPMPGVTATLAVVRTATPIPSSEAAVRVPTGTPMPVCSSPGVCVSYPWPEARLRGVVVIKGTALIEGFRFYKVEFGAGAEPATWHSISEEHDEAVANGVLDNWSTDPLPAGTYVLRLTVVDMTGNYPAPCEVKVNVE